MADDPVVGTVGEVVLRVRGADGPGEIIAVVRGTREKFIAYSDEPFECGARVLVISVRGPRSVDVIAWSG